MDLFKSGFKKLVGTFEGTPTVEPPSGVLCKDCKEYHSGSSPEHLYDVIMGVALDRENGGAVPAVLYSDAILGILPSQAPEDAHNMAAGMLKMISVGVLKLDWDMILALHSTAGSTMESVRNQLIEDALKAKEIVTKVASIKSMIDTLNSKRWS